MTNRALSLMLALVLAVSVVAVPATSFAQSAGDDQYVDPFQDDEAGNDNQGDSGSQGGGGDDTTSSEQPAAEPPADTAGSTAAEGGNGESLPSTGLMVGAVSLLGVVLLGGGLALRRAWPRRD